MGDEKTGAGGYGVVQKGWVQVQKKTFTRWINHFLSERMLKIADIEKDLDDGVMLINLLEIISSKKFAGKYNLKPKMEVQKAENINKSLTFLKEEGLKLVNVGAKDIIVHNERIILGLIWTLILRYQIQVGGEDGSPKSLLLQWVNQQIKPYGPHVPPVKNFGEDWKNGDVLSALADSLRPGLIDMKALSDPLKDTDHAMAKSEEAYHIPRLLDAQDLVQGADEHSVMTYVAQFKRWQEDEAKRNALENTNPKFSYADGPGVTQGFAGRPLPFTIHSMDGRNQPVKKGGDPFKATVTGPKGPVPVELKDNEDGTYTGTYEPSQPGQYVVNITLHDKPIKDAPYNCRVKPPADPSKTYAEGPGLEEASEGRDAHFTVHAFDVDGRPVIGEDIRTTVAPIDDSKGAPEAQVKVVDNGDGTYGVTYNAEAPGTYQINTTIVKTPIRDMPKEVFVSKAPDPAHSYADGPGTRGGFRDRVCPFTIHSIDDEGKPVTRGGDTYEVKVIGPNGSQLPVTLQDNKDGTYSGSYKPTAVGKHSLNVKFKNQDIKDSPYNVNIKEPADPLKSYAQGPGLEYAFNDKPAVFTVFAKDVNGQPVSGEDVTVEIVKSAPRPFFPPTTPGRVSVTTPSRGSVTSPDVPVGRQSRGLSVDMEGIPKVCPECGAKSGGRKFCMECGKSLLPPGVSPLVSRPSLVQSPQPSTPSTPSYTPMMVASTPSATENTAAEKVDDIKIVDNGDGTYAVSYFAPVPGVYDITCKINQKPIRDMPRTVTVFEGLDASKTYAKGPGVEGGFINRALPFTIHAIDKFGKPVKGGGDKFDVVLTDPEGNQSNIDVKDNGDGTYSGVYTPDKLGEWKVGIDIRGKPIKGSEYHLKVRKGADPKSSYAKGKGWRFAYDGIPAKFKVFAKDSDGKPVAGEVVKVKITDKTTAETREQSKNEGKLEIQESERRRRVRMNAGLSPEEQKQWPELTQEGADIPAEIKDNGDGTYTVVYTAPIPGDYVIAVTVGEDPQHIRESPKPIKCYWSCPNKPCRPLQTKLHDEINRLRKALAKLEGEKGDSGAHAHHDHSHEGHSHEEHHHDHKKQSHAQEEFQAQFEEMQRTIALQEKELKAAKQRAADLEKERQQEDKSKAEEVKRLKEELAQSQAREKTAGHEKGEETEKLRKELEESQAEIAKLQEQLAQPQSQPDTSDSHGDVSALREQLASSDRALQEAVNEKKELEHKLKEEQGLRSTETATLQKHIDEMIVAAEEMQAEFEARERELVEANRLAAGGSSTTSTSGPEAEGEPGEAT